MVMLTGPQSWVGSVPNLTKYFKDCRPLRFNIQTLLSSLIEYKSKQVLLWKQAESHIFNMRLIPLIQ